MRGDMYMRKSMVFYVNGKKVTTETQTNWNVGDVLRANRTCNECVSIDQLADFTRYTFKETK
jgi:hypothetical protein